MWHRVGGGSVDVAVLNAGRRAPAADSRRR